MKSKLLLLAAAACAASLPLGAAVQLASPFGSHMVLQNGQKAPVWGTAAAGEKVVVSFAGQTKATTAGDDGRWRIDLDPLAVSAEPRVLTVNGSASPAPLTLDDVLVGEVWICSGQSNMERQLGPRQGQKPIIGWEAAVAAANYPQMRQLYVTQTRALAPQTSVNATWSVCSPDTATDITAVGFFFGRDLLAARHVPIGLIHSSWGGTLAEAWTSRAGLAAFPEFADALAAIDRNRNDPAAAERTYAEELTRWFTANDPGSGEHPFSQATDADAANWETMNLPTLWEDAGHPGFDGIAWFRRTFDLPAGWAGHDLVLHLSAVDDEDTTWVNGTQVGTTNDWQAPRTYLIPASVLKPTGNVIAVRVLDTGGGGGIWNTALPLDLALAHNSAARLSLKGPWQCKFTRSLSGVPPVPVNPNVGPNVPTVLYNAMIAPLVPFGIRGVIFYQGEANSDRAKLYRTQFPALIADWRKQWGEGDFPFLFVQIAPWHGMPPEIREAQFIAWQHTPNTAMAVTIDVGDAEDIHPANKAPVGARLALAARALAYGETLEYSGPAFEKAEFSGNRAVLHFTHLGGGLVAPGGKLLGFTVAGKDGAFHPATAEIVGDTVVVTSSDVAVPAAVRYAWANVPVGNLFNRSGLPASPFRTDVD